MNDKQIEKFQKKQQKFNSMDYVALSFACGAVLQKFSWDDPLIYEVKDALRKIEFWQRTVDSKGES